MLRERDADRPKRDLHPRWATAAEVRSAPDDLAALADRMANSCRGSGPANCVARCPLHVDAHGYMQLTRLGRFREALQLIREQLPFPGILGHVCVHPCELHCKRIDEDSAIRIRDVKRFLAEWEPGDPQHVVDRLPDRQERVAVIGAGPAGLLAAYDLRRLGFGVSLFERERQLGGCLRYRIPEWRLPAAVRDRDLSIIDDVGLKVHTGVDVGPDLSIQELCATHHAVLLLAGYGGGQRLLDRESFGLMRSGRQTVRVDPLTGESGIEGVFAGGDAVSGPGTVIHALAWGRRVAESAHRFLEGKELSGDREPHRPPDLLWKLDVDEAERRRRERPPVMLHPVPESMTETQSVEEGERCLDCVCGLCTEQCEFLTKYCDAPRELAAKIRNGPAQHLQMVYSCNLCGLCREVCPVDLDAGDLMLAARRRAVREDMGPLDSHRREVRFFRLGVSSIFTLAMAEPGRRLAKRMFFAGCALPAASPRSAVGLYREICRLYPGTGVLMHCCGAPAEAMGMEDAAESARRSVVEQMERLSAEELIVACPGCRKSLERSPSGIKVRSVWELLAEDWQPRDLYPELQVGIHDPCAARHDDACQGAVRQLLSKMEIGLEEDQPAGRDTRCCGLGGQIKPVDSPLVAGIARRRSSEFQGPIVTYCARCRASLHRGGGSTLHIAQLVLGTDPTAAIDRAPLGTVRRYTNRLLAKRAFRKLQAEGLDRVR